LLGPFSSLLLCREHAVAPAMAFATGFNLRRCSTLLLT
jgi:hypothetical protein